MAETPIFDRPAAIRRLEEVRLTHGLTKARFADSLGIHASNYSRLVKGKFFLTTEHLYAVWRLYGAETWQILGEGEATDMTEDQNETTAPSSAGRACPNRSRGPS